MGKIYYIIGKSASGKDTLLQKVLGDGDLHLKGVVQYTTRPRRDGETEGKEYHFIQEEKAAAFRSQGRIIEERAYETVQGLWRYMMVDDAGMDLSRNNYAAVGTVESYSRVRAYFGDEKVVPIYLDVEPGERLSRALYREKQRKNPQYAEMCRRFLADEADFDEEHMKRAGLMNPDGTIRNRVENASFDGCFREVKGLILRDQQL